MRTLSGCIVGNSIHPQGSLWKPFSLAARSLTFLFQPRHPIQSLESKPRHIPNTSLYLTLVSRKTAEQFGLSFTKSCQICSYIARPPLPSPMHPAPLVLLCLPSAGSALLCRVLGRQGSLPCRVHTGPHRSTLGFQSSSSPLYYHASQPCLSLWVL